MVSTARVCFDVCVMSSCRLACIGGGGGGGGGGGEGGGGGGGKEETW